MFRRENREEKECEERFLRKLMGLSTLTVYYVCYYRHTQSVSQSVS